MGYITLYLYILWGCYAICEFPTDPDPPIAKTFPNATVIFSHVNFLFSCSSLLTDEPHLPTSI